MNKTLKELCKKRSKYRLDGKIRSFCHGQYNTQRARWHEVALMRDVKSYSACVQDLMDAWIESQDRAEAADICRCFTRPTQRNVVLAVIDCKVPEEGSFSATFVRRSTIPTDILQLAAIQTPFAFGSFPDQEYLRNSAIPALNEVLMQRRPSFSRGCTIFGGCMIVYESLLVPQKSTIGRSEWCILLAKIDLLLPKVSGLSVDDTELSILQLLTEGATQKEIGVTLTLSPRTIEHRIERLKIRMGAKNLQHLSALWIANKIADAI